MGSVFFVKMSVDTFEDEKILIIEGMPEGDAVYVIFQRLIFLAGKINDGGLIYVTPDMPYTPDSLSIVFKRPVTIIKLALEMLSKLKMIEIQPNGYLFVCNFPKWQSMDRLDKIREKDRLRQQKHRGGLKTGQSKLLKEAE